jgi:hypothetical protein
MPLLAVGQDATLVAGVDRTAIRANESFTYTLRANGQLAGRPDLSVLARDFEVIDTGSSTQIQILNGRTTQVAEWTVELMPQRAGRFELPPVEVGGIFSNAVTVEILPSSQDGEALGDIFIEVELDRDIGYVQAQTIYTLRLFVGIGTGRASLTAPLIEGGEAIVEKLGADREYRTLRGNRDYNVRERQYVIFPQSSGTLTIGPAVFEVMVMPNFGIARQQRLRSDVVQLEVRPAVAPPAAHPDAVWLPAANLSLTENWTDRGTAFEQGVPRTRVFTVTAEGLLETQLPELKFVDTPGLRQYPEQPELSREITAAGIEGRRTERFAVIAQRPGSIDLPAVELPWFNVAEERWEVARIAGTTVDVLPSAGLEVVNEPVIDAGPAPASIPDSGFWPWFSGALALGWFATALAWVIRARVGRPARAPAAVVRPPSSRSLLKQLAAACRVNDAHRTRELLLDWARLQFAEDPPVSLGALAARLSGGLAEEILLLEAALYGPSARDWNGQRLAELLKETRSVGRRGDGKSTDPLVPLYR